MNKEIIKLLNEQYTLEMESAFKYKDMSNWAEDTGLPGVAQWFLIQFDEEMEHAEMFAKYLKDRDVRPTFRSIEVKNVNYTSILNVAEETLKAEQDVTAKINNIMALAKKENDFATEEFLNFFVREQVEEEANAKDIINLVKLHKDNIHFVDQEMGKRVAE